MTVDGLIVLTASIISLIFSYLPGLQTRFGQLNGSQKRLIMLAALWIVAIMGYILSCTEVGGWLALDFDCSRTGLYTLLKLLFEALVANQTTYALSPRGMKNV
ncbi:MAG: hypothetical protein ACPL3P_05870 [Anaerolineales bacterium]